MWFEEMDEIAELFRGYFPYYLIIALPIFIIISPVNPVAGAHEFPVYRMQQYDLHGVPHGCRSSSLNMEARPLSGWSTFRHCVVTQLQDLTVDTFHEIISKAGGLLVILPGDISSLMEEERQHLIELESALMLLEVSIPVYFIPSTPELEMILDDISHSFTDDHSSSAAEALINSISANGYQVVVGSSSASAKSDMQIANIQGKLSGYGIEDKLPTVALVAHYDSFGIAPDLSFGADSNGSGVAMLLELARLFSHLYTSSRTHARFNILFLLSGGGKFNYQGSKKWLEDQLDGVEGSLLQDASYTLCLDSVSSGDGLYLHVSKPPKEGSPGDILFKEMKFVASQHYPNVTVDTVHKKINLADDLLAWEHERHSIRRLPAFTLSALQTFKDSRRSTIFDTKEMVDIERLTRNTKIVAEALARHIYNLSVEEVFFNALGVETESLEAWMDFLSSHPRSAQLLAEKHNPVVITLQDVMSRYLKEVKVSYLVPDKRDPEFVFYDVSKSVVNVYGVKPAVFDLFLTIAIVVYLAVIYLFIQNFSLVYSAISRFATASKSKSQ